MNRWMNTVFVVAACIAPMLGYSAEPKPEPRDFAWVEKHAQELEPTAKERRIDEIGWTSDIRQAERLAGENSRPVFLFTYDGHINTGRC